MEEKEEGFGCSAADLLLCDEEGESLSLCEPRSSNAGSETEHRFTELPLIDDECFCWMVEREKDYMLRDDYVERLRSGEIDFGLRREAFDWMLKACVHHSFGEVSLYSAMNYFDRFLSVYELPEGKTWAALLVAVACLLLAAKMEEINVPNAIDLQSGLFVHQTGETRFLFEARAVHRMEMILLNNLNWSIKPCNPINFVEYFLCKTNHSKLPQQPLISRAIRMLPCIIKGIDFLEFRPSEIAAAVAIYISGETQVAMDFPDKALPCSIRVEKGKVSKCLKLIRDSISTHSAASGSLFCVTSSPNGVLEAVFWSHESDESVLESPPRSSGGHNGGSKRRRLEVNGNQPTVSEPDP